MQDITTLQVQRATKPKIEDVLPHFMDGEILERALDFVAYLRANRMNPAWAGVHNAWKGVYKGKPIYYIRLGREWIRPTENVKWTIIPYLNHMEEYREKIFDQGWQDIIWNDLHFCRGCNNGCSPGFTRAILGKEFAGLCHGIFYSGRKPVSFVNPGDETFNIIKQLLEFEKTGRNPARL